MEINFSLPTKLIIKENPIVDIKNELTNYKKILIITCDYCVDSLILEQVTNVLDKENILYETIAGVKANLETRSIDQGLEKFKSFEPDCILAIGGGATLDVAKGILYFSTTNNKYDSATFDNSITSSKVDIGYVCTCFFAGSGMNNSCSYTYENKKRTIPNEMMLPKFTIGYGISTFDLPKIERQIGLSDTLSHLFEQYFGSDRDEGFPDRILEAYVLTMIKNHDSYINQNDKEVHEEINTLCALSLNKYTSIYKNRHDWNAHLIGEYFTTIHNVRHGQINAIVHPIVIQRYYDKGNMENLTNVKFENLAKYVFNCTKEEVCTEISKLFFNISGINSLGQSGIEYLDQDIIDKLMIGKTDFGYINFDEKDYEFVIKMLRR